MEEELNLLVKNRSLLMNLVMKEIITSILSNVRKTLKIKNAILKSKN